MELRLKRRRSLRSAVLFVIGFCSVFACFSWYTMMCCRPNIYGEYVINNYPLYPSTNAVLPKAQVDDKQNPSIYKRTSSMYKNVKDIPSSFKTVPIKSPQIGGKLHPEASHRTQLVTSEFRDQTRLDPKLTLPKTSHQTHQDFLKASHQTQRDFLESNHQTHQDSSVASHQTHKDSPETSHQTHTDSLEIRYRTHPASQLIISDSVVLEPVPIEPPDISKTISDSKMGPIYQDTRTYTTMSPQSIPPTIDLDRYAVKAWLPRGIKERVEGNSYESTRDPLSMSYNTDTRVKRSVISPPVKRLPQALIIGVKKCGTRALLEFLRVHPDVRASGPETHFFDRHYQRGLEWYRQQMPTSLEGQITMEKTPSYFITKEVPPRIRSMSGSVRLLVVVRDPVTRAVSDYTQSSSKRKKDSASFEDMAFLNASTGLVDTSWSAIRLGVYSRFLEWWHRYFHMSQIHFVSGENLIRDPAGEMALVQDFLGLKIVISDKHFYFNETKGFPCLKKSEGSGNPHCLGKTKGRAHPDISLSTIQRLRDFYRPFNVKFYQMVGRNFGWP